MFYKCDPNKNKKCTKENCYINGGECELTTNRDYAAEEKEQHESKID